MRRSILFIFFCLAVAACTALPDPKSLNRSVPSTPDDAQMHTDDELQQELAEIADDAKGKVGVFALMIESDRAVSLNGADHFAMQSVYKLPISMAVVDQASKGKVDLDQKIAVTKRDMVRPGQASSIRDKYPNGTDLTVRELIRYAISESDGTASDVLMRVAGGPSEVQAYVNGLGITDMQIRNTEMELGKDWQVQYDNWSTPEAAVDLLEALWKQKGSVPRDADQKELLLMRVMYDSTPGANRLKGLLPKDTPVAHKTGTSGTRDGITAATNDIGLISLPNGQTLAIAVFVGDSKADEKTREAVIARIAKAVWDKWSK